MSKTIYLQDARGFTFTTSFPEYHKECTKLTAKAGEAAIKLQSMNELLKLIKPGSTIRTNVNHVSANGMTRRISCYIVDPRDNDIICIDSYVSDITGYKNSDKGGLIVSGCGMDMGFHLVYTLGAMLWPNGTDTAHGTRNGQPDSTGGYALKQRSL